VLLLALSLFPFFSYCLGVHLDLHSFPTRRSSDLFSSADGQQHLCRLVQETIVQFEPRLSSVSVSIAEDKNPLDRILKLRIRATRSEEHTSELQSRENLVCRLLLEKKKQKSTHSRV